MWTRFRFSQMIFHYSLTMAIVMHFVVCLFTVALCQVCATGGLEIKNVENNENKPLTLSCIGHQMHKNSRVFTF